MSDTFRRLRGALGNAVAWGAVWFGAALALGALRKFTGAASDSFSWLEALKGAMRASLVGGISGGVFSSVIALLYRGRRLADISWLRFGLGGGAVAGVFMPAFMFTMRTLNGDPPLSLDNYVRNGVIAGLFGGTAAAITMLLAQWSERRGAEPSRGDRDELLRAGGSSHARMDAERATASRENR